jgi:hypothetical protein
MESVIRSLRAWDRSIEEVNKIRCGRVYEEWVILVIKNVNESCKPKMQATN